MQPEEGHELLPRQVENEAVPEARREAAEEVREGVASEAVPRDVRLGDPLHDVHRHARRPLRARVEHAAREQAELAGGGVIVYKVAACAAKVRSLVGQP